MADALLFYKAFHAAPIAYRATFLSAILTDSKENKIKDEDFKNLINKIIPDDMQYFNETRELLYNHLKTFGH